MIYAAINTTNIYEFAHLSDHSYYLKLPKNYSNDPNYREIATLDNDCPGFVLKRDRHVLIPFHGSRNRKDFLADVDCRMIDFKINGQCLGKVHRGFYERFKSFENSLLQSLREIAWPLTDYNFTLTGHSMGGSLAQITALYLKALFKDVNISVVVFGSPKIFSKISGDIFSAVIDCEHHVMVKTKNKNICDPITYLFSGDYVLPKCTECILEVNTGLDFMALHKIHEYIKALREKSAQEQANNNY